MWCRWTEREAGFGCSIEESSANSASLPVEETSTRSASSPIADIHGEDAMIESTPHVFAVNTPTNGKSMQVNLQTLIDVAETVTNIVGCVAENEDTTDVGTPPSHGAIPRFPESVV